MATRLFFDYYDLGDSVVTATANGTWAGTASNHYIMFLRSTIAGRDITNYVSSGGNGDQLLSTYLSPKLKAQTISGTFKCQALCYESNKNANAYARMELYVVSEDGTTVRGTLLSGPTDYGPGSEWNVGSVQNITYADGDTMSSVDAQAGDRVVLKMGCTKGNVGTAYTYAGNGDGNDPAVELGENETDTAGVAWCEFSGDLEWFDQMENRGSSNSIFQAYNDAIHRESPLSLRRAIF